MIIWRNLELALLGRLLVLAARVAAEQRKTAARSADRSPSKPDG